MTVDTPCCCGLSGREQACEYCQSHAAMPQSKTFSSRDLVSHLLLDEIACDRFSSPPGLVRSRAVSKGLWLTCDRPGRCGGGVTGCCHAGNYRHVLVAVDGFPGCHRHAVHDAQGWQVRLVAAMLRQDVERGHLCFRPTAEGKAH